MDLHGRTVVLGISGGIAVYKVAYLASELTKHGAAVEVIMTEAAQKFVTPLTFSTLTKRNVHTDMFKEYVAKPGHISLAERADVMLIAPATANTIAKLTYGIADNLLTTTVLATQAPVIIAPAMNNNMYNHSSTQQNLEILQNRGIITVGPEEGMLACGYVGIGRMSEPEKLFEQICQTISCQ